MFVWQSVVEVLLVSEALRLAPALDFETLQAEPTRPTLCLSEKMPQRAATDGR